jgi:hypothetical protein
MDLTLTITPHPPLHEKQEREQEQELTMPTKSTPPTNPSPSAVTADPPTAAQKSAATVMRHKEERRAESLDDIRRQTANGTLVIRQMTTEQHDAASETARQTRTRNDSRVKRYRAADDPAA